MIGLLTCSCGLFKKKPEPIKVNTNIRLAGRIHSVNGSFVLIRRYGRWNVKDGEVVESRGEGRTGSLYPTGERLGEHVAADIRQGNVQPGDAVYIRVIRPSTPAKPSTDEEKQDETDSQESRDPKPPETP